MPEIKYAECPMCRQPMVDLSNDPRFVNHNPPGAGTISSNSGDSPSPGRSNIIGKVDGRVERREEKQRKIPKKSTSDDKSSLLVNFSRPKESNRGKKSMRPKSSFWW